MKYEMNLGAWNQVFAIPSAVVDQHLKLAGSAQLKVLLWLLRNAGTQNDPETIGQALGLSRADVCDAMQYWIAAGLIHEELGTFTPPEAEKEAAVQPEMIPEPVTAAVVHMAEVSGAPGSAAPAEAAPKPKEPRKTVRPHQLNTAEIAGRISGADEVHDMIDTAESIFARPLSTPEMGALISLHDWDGLPADVIIMIIQYAVNNSKCNMSYIEKMAVSWAAEGINTHEKAEEKVRVLDERKEAWNRVSRIFGLDKRLPSASESESATRWISEWKLDEALIREAYDRCVNTTGKFQFQYIGKILERWHKEGILTIRDAQADAAKKPGRAAAEPSKPRKTAAAASYDIQEFEKMALYGDNLSNH